MASGGTSKPAAGSRNRIVAVGVIGVAVVLGTVFATRSSDRQQADRLEATVTAGDCTLDSRTDDGRDHVASPTFTVDPPSGGDHLAEVAPAGEYDEGQAPDGTLVHALEHGFVILWYRPGISEADLDALKSLHDENADSTLLVARSSLDVEIAATAWHQRLLCSGLDRDGLATFVDGYRDQGPETGFM